MSIDHLLHFEVARVVIEAQSPFLVGVADGDGFHDATFASDANGLPTIPGETLAGVIRHALAAEGTRDAQTDQACQTAFGFQLRGDGAASKVEFSWAQVHDADDQPVPFIHAFNEKRKNDPVLRFLSTGVSRDHVRIDKNGVADDGGKFDVLLVPAGARFTFEVKIFEGAGIDAKKIVQLLSLPETMVGRAGRRGLGNFDVIRVASRVFDLRKPEDRKAWKLYPTDIEAKVPSGILSPARVEMAAGRWRHGRLKLRPLSTWYVGGATEPEGLEFAKRNGETVKSPAVDKPWDRFPMAEKRIIWTEGKQVSSGEVAGKADWLIPGSSIKGVLRHRTSFYARLLAGQTIDPTNRDSIDGACMTPDVEIRLFGSERDSTDDRSQSSPGRIRIGDARIANEGPGTPKQAGFEHVSLDRFTQGPVDGRLFNESTLYGGPEVEVDIAIDVDHLENAPPTLYHALKRAFDDLCEGRLALGAASSRGHGMFKGRVEWDDGKTPWEVKS